MDIYIISAFTIYLSLLLFFALIYHKKQNSSTQFMMGNRSLNFWLVALSAHASDMSSWLFMAFPMAIFMFGLPQLWIAWGLLIGMFLNWHFVAPKLRTMTEKYDCYTLSSFFDKRFSDSSGLIRFVSAIATVIFLTHYLSAGLIAMGNLFESLFGINYYIGLSVALFVIVVYTFIGGFTTVAWIDLFQGIFLLLTILIVPFMAFSKLGSANVLHELMNRQDFSLSLLPAYNFESFFSMCLLAMGWGLGYFGMPHVVTKFMSIKNPAEINKSKWLGISWQFIALMAATCVGLVGRVYFPQGLENPELVFVEMVKDLFHPFIIGFILCGVISANISTMDSQILACGSIISEDLYKHFHWKRPSDRRILFVSKMSVILVSICALLLAFNRSLTIAETVSYSWSGLGSALGPLVLMSLYSKTANKYGALAGIVTGSVVVMIWPSVGPFFMTTPLPSMIPGFFMSLLSIYVVSWMTAKRSAQETIEQKI